MRHALSTKAVLQDTRDSEERLCGEAIGRLYRSQREAAEVGEVTIVHRVTYWVVSSGHCLVTAVVSSWSALANRRQTNQQLP